jgi:hypothetical protein
MTQPLNNYVEILFAILTALEKWNLGPSSLRALNPSLIFTRVSGYGQTGPWASRPGYASVCEAESGFRYINGFPDPQTGLLSGPPVRPNISLDVTMDLPRSSRYWLAEQKLIGVKQVARLVDVSIMERQVVQIQTLIRSLVC